MKKIILSAAVAAMAFSTSAVAADKGIDIDVTGQAVLYYETHSSNQDVATGDGKQLGSDKGHLDQENSEANAGVQLNLGADLGNNFTFGSQLSYLGTLGLERDVVAPTGLKQTGGSLTDTTGQLALTKIFIAKQIGNTTLKAGRQELPKSLSPLAFTEGWQVFKSTFDAILAVNTDLPKTTLVGAYVSGGTGSFNLGEIGDLQGRTTAGPLNIDGSSYMVTAQTKLIPMTTLTASYYQLNNIAIVNGTDDVVDANAYWVDAKIAPKDAPLGLNLSLQAGQISPDSLSTGGTTELDDTTAYGAKITGKAGAVGFKAIYTSVDQPATGKHAVNVQNTGGVKSPLYSQMMYNQDFIAMDSDTIVVGASYDMGDMGSLAANYGMSDIGARNAFNTNATQSVDYTELDLVYKVKSGGVQYFAIVAMREMDEGGDMMTSRVVKLDDATEDTVIRFWARYNF